MEFFVGFLVISCAIVLLCFAICGIVFAPFAIMLYIANKNYEKDRW